MNTPSASVYGRQGEGSCLLTMKNKCIYKKSFEFQVEHTSNKLELLLTLWLISLSLFNVVGSKRLKYSAGDLCHASEHKTFLTLWVII